MKLTARNIGVYAGCIMIADYAFYQQYGYRKDCLSFLNDWFDIDKGVYLVRYKVNYSWKEKNPEGEFLLNLASGKLIVSDPCYMIEDWDSFLKDTDHCENSPDNTKIIDTGGDGMFKVTLNLKKEKPSKRMKSCLIKK